MKIAETFKQVREGKITQQAAQDPYIQSFAQQMMLLSNMLNEAEDDAYIDIEVIKDEFHAGIREFILNVTGL